MEQKCKVVKMKFFQGFQIHMKQTSKCIIQRVLIVDLSSKLEYLVDQILVIT